MQQKIALLYFTITSLQRATCSSTSTPSPWRQTGKSVQVLQIVDWFERQWKRASLGVATRLGILLFLILVRNVTFLQSDSTTSSIRSSASHDNSVVHLPCEEGCSNSANPHELYESRHRFLVPWSAVQCCQARILHPGSRVWRHFDKRSYSTLSGVRLVLLRYSAGCPMRSDPWRQHSVWANPDATNLMETPNQVSYVRLVQPLNTCFHNVLWPTSSQWKSCQCRFDQC